MSLAQAVERRGAAGVPLPVVYQSLEAREARIRRGQLTLVIGKASAGKSLLVLNLLVAMRVPSLALLLDTDQLSAAARFASIASGKPANEVARSIQDYAEPLAEVSQYVQVAFHAPDPEDIRLQLAAYEQRFGLPPDCLVVDNLGNMTSGYDNEWAMLKALTLELDAMAREEQIAVIACHHTTDLDSCEPAQRTKMLGRISQYPRLILSVGFNTMTGEYKVAAVKNSNGPTDENALNPAVLYADPARMSLSETPPPVDLARLYQQGARYGDWRGQADLREVAPHEYPELRPGFGGQ